MAATMFAFGIRSSSNSFFRFMNLPHSTSMAARFTTRLCAFSTTTATPTKRVGTHNGSFHCDEALACFMIRLTDKFSNAEIVRTRDPKVLETLDAVVDVGGVYDPSCDRYDHHQKGFDQVFGNGFNTKLSSAGLVYKHYGAEIIAKEVQSDEQSDVHRLYLAIYKNFVEAVDAVDNGINQYESDRPPRYVNNTSLSSRVESDQSSEKENEAFGRAMELAGSEFLEV
ncbi:MYG1 exonuclease [Linum grandiflorum]